MRENESQAATEANDTIEGGAGNDELEPTQTAEVEELEKVPAPKLPEEAKAALEAEYPVLTGGHGTHNAAMSGLQTDASGNYTPPDHPRFEQ
jgi:hypothetical protein